VTVQISDDQDTTPRTRTVTVTPRPPAVTDAVALVDQLVPRASWGGRWQRC